MLPDNIRHRSRFGDVQVREDEYAVTHEPRITRCSRGVVSWSLRECERGADGATILAANSIAYQRIPLSLAMPPWKNDGQSVVMKRTKLLMDE
jgi:hypothetical protein